MLVQHIDKITVTYDILHGQRTQEIADVLGQSGRNAAPFAETLPDFHRVIGCLWLLQQKMELIHIITGGFLQRPIGGNPCPYHVLDNQHPGFTECCSQILNIKTHHTVVHIHVGSMIEHILGTCNIKLQAVGNAPCRIILISIHI